MPTQPAVLEAAELSDRLGRIEALLAALVDRAAVREWYTVEEFAAAIGLRPFTVREHCHLGRLGGVKKGSGRGRYQSWVLSHDELLRFRRDGLRPEGLPKPGSLITLIEAAVGLRTGLKLLAEPRPSSVRCRPRP